jgi:hypothetical protein
VELEPEPQEPQLFPKRKRYVPFPDFDLDPT